MPAAISIRHFCPSYIPRTTPTSRFGTHLQQSGITADMDVSFSLCVSPSCFKGWNCLMQPIMSLRLPADVWRHVLANVDPDSYAILARRNCGVSREFYWFLKNSLSTIRVFHPVAPLCGLVWLQSRDQYFSRVKRVEGDYLPSNSHHKSMLSNPPLPSPAVSVFKSTCGVCAIFSYSPSPVVMILQFSRLFLHLYGNYSILPSFFSNVTGVCVSSAIPLLRLWRVSWVLCLFRDSAFTSVARKDFYSIHCFVPVQLLLSQWQQIYSHSSGSLETRAAAVLL